MSDRLALRTEVTIDGNLEGEIILTQAELSECMDELKLEADECGLSLYVSPVVFDSDLQAYISNGDYELFYRSNA